MMNERVSFFPTALFCCLAGCEHAETKLKVSDLEEDRAAKRALVEQANKVC